MGKFKEKLKGRRVSKNIEDITDPKEAKKHKTKAEMGRRHAGRTLGTSNMGNRVTTHNNIVAAEEPFAQRLPRLIRDKPKTTPKDAKSFEKTTKKPKAIYKAKTKRVDKDS